MLIAPSMHKSIFRYVFYHLHNFGRNSDIWNIQNSFCNIAIGRYSYHCIQGNPATKMKQRHDTCYIRIKMVSITLIKKSMICFSWKLFIILWIFYHKFLADVRLICNTSWNRMAKKSMIKGQGLSFKHKHILKLCGFYWQTILTKK